MVEMEEEDTVMSEYYGDDVVPALIAFKVDTKYIESIASKLSSSPYVEDLFLVTGDKDMIIKAKFPSYERLKNFVLETVPKIEGVKETQTMMIVTTYKERGVLKTVNKS